MSEFRAVSTTNVEGDPKELFRHIHELARAINLLGFGKSGNVVEITLTANSATTAWANQSGLSVGKDTAFFFFPTTANAQAELANPGPPYAGASDIVPGQVTFHHANGASTDRTFKMLVVG